ncbi:MAG: hypothetical protein ABJB03_07545 [Rhodoglobus sp.]
MTAMRLVVDDVDAALAALEPAGFTLVERWGPPFAILERDGTEFWVSGPGTSAAKATDELPETDRVCAAVRPVIETDDAPTTVASLVAVGWVVAAGPVTGPGGSQQLLRNAGLFVEVFASA